jgi:hypothetical protein
MTAILLLIFKDTLGFVASIQMLCMICRRLDCHAEI